MTKNININLLIPFENHPFKKRDGIEQRELVESIAQNGLLEPIRHNRSACDNQRNEQRRGDNRNGGFKYSP